MRRYLAPPLVALLVAALWTAAPAFSSRPWHPRALDFGAGVPQPAAASAGRLTTRSVTTPKRFDMLGFAWRGHTDPQLSVRVHKAGGDWSPWVAASHGDGPPGHGDPVWAGGADRYQMRLRRRVSGLRVHFINVTGTATRSDRLKTALRSGVRTALTTLVPDVATAASAPAAGQPPIASRASWDPNNQCAPKAAPDRGTIHMAFVHHTVSANDYSPSQVPGIILAICRYHENGNGWNDIGYNFLVDKYGKLWEGRAGGITQPVIGAHTLDYNSVSFGVSNIGTYSASGQTSTALHALGRLIGWKMALSGAPTTGTYTAPSGRVLNRISGHRDANQTECPGNALYAQLPLVRQYATAAAGQISSQPQLTLQATKTAVTWPAPVRLHGRLLLPNGASAAGQAIDLQARSGTTWTTVGHATSARDGTFAASLVRKYSGRLRARWSGGGVYSATASAGLATSVAPKVTVTLSRTSGPVGTRVRVGVRTYPWKGRVKVVLDRQTGARWVNSKVWRASTQKGRLTVTTPKLAHATRYRIAASTALDARSAYSRSRSQVVTVRAAP